MILAPPPLCSRLPVALDLNRRRRSLAPRFRRRVLSAAGSRDVDAFTEYSGYLFEVGDTEADSLTEYSVSKIVSVYRRRPLTVLRRVVQVGATLGRWFVQRYIDGVGENAELMFEVIACSYLCLTITKCIFFTLHYINTEYSTLTLPKF